MLAKLRSLHRDQKGLEALQVIIILTLAAIILATLFYFWSKYSANGATGIKGWVTNNLQVIFGGSGTQASSTGDLTTPSN